MPTNLKSILLTDLARHNGTAWQSLTAKNNTTPEDLVPLGGEKVILYHNDTPNAAPQETERHMFVATGFKIVGQSVSTDTFTLFHGSGFGIPTTAVSPMIRYKITVVTNDGSNDTEMTNPEYYYMMLKAGFAADAFSGAGSAPATVGGTAVRATLRFYFPAYNATQVGQAEYERLKGLLETEGNWRIMMNSAKYTPLVASMGQVITNLGDVALYGVGKAVITLEAILQIPAAGTYPITVQFSPNGVYPQGQFAIPGSHSITATLDAYTGAAQDIIVTTGQAPYMFVRISQ